MGKKKNNEITVHSSAAEYLTYVAAAGSDERSFEMRYESENIWLTQKMIAALYNVSIQNVGQHIKKIFDDGELSPDSVVKKYFITAADGKDYETMHYNLQMIIAVGFKVNNDHAVQFRKWAGQIVKDYTIQGWVMDVDRLKKGHMFTDEYFERQLQTIREIRPVSHFLKNENGGSYFLQNRRCTKPLVICRSPGFSPFLFILIYNFIYCQCIHL